MSNDKPKKRKKIVGARVRVGIGDNVRFEDDEDAVVRGEDITLVVSPEEAKGKDIIGKEVIVQVGTFNPVFKQIEERENLDDKTRKELKARIRELEKELAKKSPDKNKVDRMIAALKSYSWLVQIIISTILKPNLHG